LAAASAVATLAAWTGRAVWLPYYSECNEYEGRYLMHVGSGYSYLQEFLFQAAAANVRDGRVTRLVLYYDGERALADHGVAPEADTPRT